MIVKKRTYGLKYKTYYDLFALAKQLTGHEVWWVSCPTAAGAQDPAAICDPPYAGHDDADL